MVSTNITVEPEKVTVVEYTNDVQTRKVIYELGSDHRGMAFRRLQGANDGDWEPCHHLMNTVREFIAKGGTLGSVLGHEWSVIAEPGSIWKAFRTTSQEK